MERHHHSMDSTIQKEVIVLTSRKFFDDLNSLYKTHHDKEKFDVSIID